MGGNGEQCLLGGPETGRTPQDNRGREKCEGLWPAWICSAEVAVGAPRAARRARTRWAVGRAAPAVVQEKGAEEDNSMLENQLG